MSLESATYINGLQAANPAESDPAGLSADHIRLIKATVLATFPNITGPVTVRQDQINNAMPYGSIIMYSGTTFPAGWALCNGGTYAKSDGSGNVTTPDLLDRVPICAGLTYGLGALGGATVSQIGVTTDPHALTIAEMPSHNHGVSDPGHSHSVNDPGHFHSYSGPVGSTSQSGTLNPVIGSSSSQNTTTNGTGISLNASGTGISVGYNGSGAGHTHTLTSPVFSIMPPYIGVYFIFKL